MRTSPRCPLLFNCAISYVLYPRHHWRSLMPKKEILQYSQIQSHRRKEIIFLMQEPPGSPCAGCISCLCSRSTFLSPLLAISSPQQASRIFSPTALSSFCLPVGWLLQPQTASHRLVCCHIQPLLSWCTGARAASSCAPFTV